MNYVECPHTAETSPSLFLAGGITGCPNWQAIVVEQLKETPLTLFNPRRQQFPIDDPTASTFQIRWEYDHLRKADAILFWFPCETLCPIVLYELGAWSMTSKPLFVGVHPQYQRRQDVQIQTALVCPDVEIVHSLEDLVSQVRHWLYSLPTMKND